MTSLSSLFKLSSSGLGKKFFGWFLVISLIPLTVVSIISYRAARENLIADTSSSLTAMVELKKRYIEAFFDEKVKNLILETRLAANVRFLTELRQLHESLSAAGPALAGDPRWQRLVASRHEDLERFRALFGYHDVLFIDPQGNILYSISKVAARGENILKGPLAATNFAHACQRSLATGETFFSDLGNGSAIGHELDSFLVGAVRGDKGDIIGLMALEIPLEQVDALMQDRTGMGETGETFLVGSDLLMRSDSWQEQESTALRVRVESDPVKQWFAVESAGAKAAKADGWVSNYVNHRGVRVFGAISNLDGLARFGIHWIVVAEVAESEAMALVTEQRQVVVLLLFGTFLVVTGLAVLITRSIVSPIKTLSAWTGLVAQGDLSPVAARFPGDEIGDLYKSFSRMVQSFQDVARVCEAVAVGNFDKSVVLRGENDVLGQAVNQMGDNLRAAVRQADVVAQGDFTVQIIPWSAEDRLGTALLRMTMRLREMADANRMALADARRLADYLDKLPTPVLCMDRDFKLVYINNAGAAVASRAPAACLGRHCYEFFCNAHCRTGECRVGRAMQSRQVEEAETIIDPDGRKLPIRYVGAPVFGEDGEVVGALEYFFDINETKQAFAVIEKENWIQSGISLVNDRLRGEQDLHELCNSLLSGLAEHLPLLAGAVYVVDEGELQLHGTYATSGQGTARERFVMGEGIVGQAVREQKTLVVDAIPSECVRLVASIVEAVPRQLVVVPLSREGEVKGVLELGFLASVGDAAIAFLERVAGNIAIALHSVQVRMQLAALLAETQRQAQELQVQQEELQATNEELEAQTHSLKEREVELQAQHEELMTLNEELEEKTESLQRQKADIETKNIELEEARHGIERKAEELAIASKYKSEFMANMSHELRTPLNSLLLLSHNLAQNKEGNLNEEQVESARVMYSSGNDLLELINELLDLAKIEAGRVELAVTQVSLEEMAERLADVFQALCRDKGLLFSVDIDPHAPATLTTDRQRLEQILRNLVSNAIKFTDQGGVTVSVRPLAGEDAPAKEGLVIGKAIAIAVTDTGIGIPPEKQKIIFEAFQQADGSTSRKYGGTGLGLSISRELAELLGGEIQVTSTTGRGSTFLLYLPLAVSPPAAAAPPAVAPASLPSPRPRPAAGPRRARESEAARPAVAIADDRQVIGETDKTVLIIEDDLHFVKYLIKQGHDKGFKCLASADGQGGLVLAEQFRPSAVILDINLPDMTGWEVLDALKKNPLLRHIPVHMMSAEEKTLDAFKKGAVGYLHKPVNQDELRGAFDRLEEFIANEIRELLVVEDDQLLRQQIVRLIGNGDVNTTAVATGAEVIAILRERSFDCMILDIGLPDMTGFELLDRLEKEGDIAIPPVIVYTGRELTREEHDSLYRYTDSIIIKGVKSVERLLDETALFLHRVVDKMPADKRKMIVNLYEQDAMFIGKRVLIVDDDMRNAFALSKILSEKQMEVLIANTGFKALETLAGQADGVDLVLMDIMMPEMDGYEAMRRIRAQERFWDLPIIALTAKAMPEDKQKCLAAGANDYLAKPIAEARLFSMMRIWLYR